MRRKLRLRSAKPSESISPQVPSLVERPVEEAVKIIEKAPWFSVNGIGLGQDFFL